MCIRDSLYTTLSEAGYRVGRYISPSVYSYREKMEVAGSAVSREQFAGYVTRVAAAIKEMTTDCLLYTSGRWEILSDDESSFGQNTRRNLDERRGNVWKTAVGASASGSL